MKYILSILISLLFTINSYSQQKFEPIPIDKQYHLAAGFAVGTVGYIVGWEITQDRRKAILISIGVTATVGLLKEWHDSKTHEFDFNDVIYTTIGGLSASVTFDLLNVVGRKKEKQLEKLKLVQNGL